MGATVWGRERGEGRERARGRGEGGGGERGRGGGEREGEREVERERGEGEYDIESDFLPLPLQCDMTKWVYWKEPILTIEQELDSRTKYNIKHTLSANMNTKLPHTVPGYAHTTYHE